MRTSLATSRRQSSITVKRSSETRTLWPAEFQRSVAYLSLGQLKEARPSIDRTIVLLSEFSESPELQGITAKAYTVSGEIALAEGNRELAEAAFRRALEKNPRAGQAHAGLAEILLAK
jgi:Tfp pilus assembly protein PilF